MNLPDVPTLSDEVLAALAGQHHLSASQITPLPDIGITNRLYRFGDALILRVPRSHPYIINLLRKEARVVPAARAAGVQTPALVAFDNRMPMWDTRDRKRKSFWLDATDEEALASIRHQYGCESESQALRLAIRALARHPKLALTLPPTPKHAKKPGKEPEA
jgi:hypothetical protein